MRSRRKSWSNKAFTSGWLVTSQRWAEALPPAARICWQVAAAADSFTSRTRITAPCAANFKAMACPMPLPPPVTTATLPSRRKVCALRLIGQSETPRFQGMKSSCAFCSALVRTSPLATLITRSRMSSPICSMVFLPGDDCSSIDVDDVVHALRQIRVGGKLYDWSDRIAGRRAQAGGEQHHACSGADLRCDALHVIARRALQIQARLGRVFGIVEHCGYGRRAALLRRSGGFHGVGQKSVAHISGRRIHVEAGAHGRGAGGIVAHQLNEAIADFFVLAAIDQFLLHAAQLREFRENRSAAQSGKQIGGVSDGGIRGDAGEAVGAPALQTDAQIGERSGSALRLVGFDQPEKRLPDRVRHHCRLGTAALLLENEQAACRTWDCACEFRRGGLRSARAGSPGSERWRLQRSGGECSPRSVPQRLLESSRVPPQPPFVQQKADAVDILEQAAALRGNRSAGWDVNLDLVRLSFSIQPCQFGNLAAVELGRGEIRVLLRSACFRT